MSNSIGTFEFVRLSSMSGRADGVETVSQHSEIVQRPGIDGTALLQLGLKGKPFQLSSMVDVDTFANAQNLRLNYKSIVAAGLYEVVVAGTNYSTAFDHKYIILDVESIASPVACSRGGLTGGGLAKVEAVWTLIPVFVG